MPYMLLHNHGKWCVVKRDSGKPVPGGCHPSRQKALAHMRAMYANVPDAKGDMHDKMMK